MILEGHGTQMKGPGGQVPEGTWLKLPQVQELEERAAQRAAEDGIFPSPVRERLLVPGEEMPNLVLHPVGEGIQQRSSSTTVKAATRLCDILEPNMGMVVWVACRLPH